MLDSNHNPFQLTGFMISAAKLAQCPEDQGLEIAFAGRSNAGKSSAINCITGQNRLAKTSKTPGRTQLLNFFAVQDGARIVDLPGYGYAKVPLAMKKQWEAFIDQYLRERQSLAGLFLIMDIRQPLKPFDEMILNWAAKCELPVHILLTKADKLKFGPAKATLLSIRKALSAFANVTVQLFSAQSRLGLEEARSCLAQWLDISEQTPEK